MKNGAVKCRCSICRTIYACVVNGFEIKRCNGCYNCTVVDDNPADYGMCNDCLLKQLKPIIDGRRL